MKSFYSLKLYAAIRGEDRKYKFSPDRRYCYVHAKLRVKKCVRKRMNRLWKYYDRAVGKQTF